MMMVWQTVAAALVRGVLGQTTVYVPSFQTYPGYTGALDVGGSMTIVGTNGSDTTAKLTLTWSLTGLDTACVANAGDNVTNGCGIHVHTGTDCTTAGDVGGHYYSSALSDDPWAPIVYVATAAGFDDHGGVDVVTGLSIEDITGRVMVVHELDSGTRVACGVIGTETGAGSRVYVPSFQTYPGYTGALDVGGSMTIVGTSGSDTTAKQTLTWSLTGLDTACVANAGDSVTNGCGIHVHTGTDCTTADDVGGHYYSSALSDDPWAPVVYVATADGSSNENGGVDVVTGLSIGDITGRVMVVHELDSGTRIACGVIGTETGAGSRVYVPSFQTYPGYTGALDVGGSMTIVGTSGSDTTAKQTLTWSLTGLDTACVANAGDNVTNGCGIHVHTGTDCTTADDVGGHYYSSALSDDPWAPIVYVATAAGSSNENGGVDVVTGLSIGDITSRVMVVHELDSGARIACGVIGTETGAASSSAFQKVRTGIAALLGVCIGVHLL